MLLNVSPTCRHGCRYQQMFFGVAFHLLEACQRRPECSFNLGQKGGQLLFSGSAQVRARVLAFEDDESAPRTPVSPVRDVSLHLCIEQPKQLDT